jgi:hypothetical protein
MLFIHVLEAIRRIDLAEISFLTKEFRLRGESFIPLLDPILDPR